MSRGVTAGGEGTDERRRREVPRRLGAVFTVGRRLGEATRRIRMHGIRHWAFRERADLLRIVKTAVAASIAWWLATLVSGPDPALAPLAAVFTVQLTVYGSLIRAVEQTIEVVGGMLLALLLGHLIGVRPVAIAAVVTLAFVACTALRIEVQAPQIASSALIVLLWGSGYGTARVIDTLLGAAVGVVVNLAVIPPLHVRGAGEALANLGEDISDLLAEMATGMRRPWTVDTAFGWLERAQRLDEDLHEARSAVARGEESLRLNPRGRRAWSMIERRRRGLATLENAVAQVQSLARNAIDLAELSRQPPRSEVLEMLGDLVGLAAELVRQLGRILRGTSRGSARAPEKLASAIETSRQLQRRALPAMHHSVTAEDPAAWPIYGALLNDLRRLVNAVAEWR